MTLSRYRRQSLVAATANMFAAAFSAVLPANSAQAAADIERYVGYACHNGVPLDSGALRHNAACVWMNIDHTNQRIRAYAEANGVFEPAEANGRLLSTVAVSYLRRQQQGADRV